MSQKTTFIKYLVIREANNTGMSAVKITEPALHSDSRIK
jgi:hypothetical protein